MVTPKQEEMNLWKSWKDDDELVIVIIEGGIARVARQPDHISVALVDLDNEAIGEASFNDENGEPIFWSEMGPYILGEDYEDA